MNYRTAMLFKSWEQLLAVRRLGGLYRTLVIDVKKEEDQLLPKRKYVRKKPVEIKRPKELQSYFNTPERHHILSTFPEPMLRKKKKIPDGLYNTSEDAARIIVDHLKKDLPAERQLLEAFPGTGHITKLLINETKNHLLLYEPEEKFHESLSVILSFFFRFANLNLRFYF